MDADSNNRRDRRFQRLVKLDFGSRSGRCQRLLRNSYSTDGVLLVTAPIFDEENEFAVQADVLDLYSVDKTFKSTAALRDADPFVFTLTAPWSLKSELFGHAYKLDLAPGYEFIGMAVQGDSWKPIVQSALLNINNLFVMTPRWFANYNVETRKDGSGLDTTTNADNADAIKVKFANVNIIILNEAKDKFATGEIGYTMNQAIGNNITYNRVDLAVGYLQPFYWDTTVNAKLNYYFLNYSSVSGGRVDQNYTLSGGGSKRINEKLTAGVVAAYNINNSTVDIDAYKKWTVMATLTSVFGL